MQTGSPAEIARAPRTSYVARLVGLNLLRGHASGGTVALDGGGSLQVVGDRQGPVYVALRPSAVTVAAEQQHTSARNTWRGTVLSLEARGDTIRASIAGPPDVLVDLTATAVAELRLVPGAPVWCAVKATDLEVYGT